ncbi:MAG TPA: flippase [Candidatus Dormibacteraeota bacterium]|nr:flippase [Candidatus Dormibacteraeota bacterium]
MTAEPARQTPLVRSGTITLASRIVVFGLSLVAGVILARTLGPHGRGLYALALVAPSALTLVANLGISQALTYHLARKTYPVEQLIGQAIALALVLGGITALILIAVMAAAGRWILPGVPLNLVIIAAASIPLALFFYFSLSFEQGLEKFIGFNALYLVNAVALVLLLIPLFFARGNVTFAVTAWSLSWIPTAALGLYLLARAGHLNIRLDLKVARALLRFGIVGYLSFVTNFLNFRLDTFLVNIFANATQVGFYAVAVGLAETIWYVASAAATVLAPRVASTEAATSDITTGRVSRVVFATSLLGAIALALVAPPLIRILFGTAFGPSVVAVWLLLPGIVTLSVARVLSSYLLGRNRLRVDFFASLAGLAVTLVLDLTLIPRYGFAGAAVASSVAYTTTLVVNMRWVVRNSQLTVRSLLVPTRADLRSLRQYWPLKA